MEEEVYWKHFERTGNVEDYLCYKNYNNQPSKSGEEESEGFYNSNRYGVKDIACG